jgi:hypothetical protein
MPAFNDSGFFPPWSLNPGQPGYSIGSFNDNVPYTKVLISNVGVTSNVANLVASIVEGPIPTTSNNISVLGTQSNSGALNVVNTAITAANFNTKTGNGTLGYNVTTANIANNTVDGGVGIIKQIEVGENVANNAAYAGQAFALPSFTGQPNAGRPVNWAYDWLTPPSVSCNVALEGAIKLTDFDNNQQVVIDSGASLAGETRIVNALENINFLRVNVSALNSNAACSLIAKVQV